MPQSQALPDVDYAGFAASAVLHGDEDAFGIRKEGIKIKAREFLPHRQQGRS